MPSEALCEGWAFYLMMFSDFKGFLMYYVYLLKSLTHSQQKYIGYTTDLDARLYKHNTGGSVHTAKYRPWNVEIYLWFQTKSTAIAFEKYLKSGSGIAFAQKRLW